MSNDARLLDSSVVIRHFRQGGAITAKLATFGALYLSSVALGELHSGVNRSARPAKNLAQVRAFVAGVIVLPIDEATAEHYGQISANSPRRVPQSHKMTCGSPPAPCNGV